MPPNLGAFPPSWPWWAWTGLGLALLIAELLLPGTFLMWLGIAALLTGAVAWLLPSLGLAAEVVLFAALSGLTVAAWLRYRPLTRAEPPTTLNRRGAAMVGQVFALAEPIVNGTGRARVGDSLWRVRGPDGLDRGERVRVVAVEGASLVVEAA